MMFKTKTLLVFFLVISLMFYSQTRLPGASGGSGGGEGSIVNLDKEVQLKIV